MLLKTSYQRELDKFCKVLLDGDFNIRQVTKGALTQARAKLNPWAFQRLNEVCVNTFYDEAEYLEWEQMRVLAVDGSRLKLPQSKSIAEEFGVYTTGSKNEAAVSVANCSILYDVLNHVSIDAQIGSHLVSEIILLEHHFPKLKSGDLLLADRGYPSQKLMIQLSNLGVEFCFRMKTGDWKEVKKFIATGLKEQVVEFKVPKLVLSHFDENDRSDKMKCRFVKIELDDGSFKILCTSLIDTKKFNYDQFDALYHLRWAVEEEYKLLKSRIELEAFTGMTARSVYQDFHAKVLMMTLCATMAYPIAEKVKAEYAKEKSGNKFDQQINRTAALGFTKESLMEAILKKLHQQFIDALDFLIEKTREAIRPYRSNKRSNRRKRLYHSGYKPIP